MTGSTLGQAAVLSLAVAAQVSFVWAIRRFFVPAGGLQRGMRAIALLGALYAAAQLGALAWRVAEPVPSPAWPLVGAALFAASLALFWSAVAANRRRPLTLAFSADAPEHLVDWGPYRYIRHPFYAAYSLTWLAGAVAAAAPPLLVCPVVMGWLYVRAAQAEEAKFARSGLSREYAAYRARTGMLFPRLGRAAPQSQALAVPGDGAA